MPNNINYNPFFDLVFEEDEANEGTIDQCKNYLSEIKGFKLFHMNVCSLRAKHSELTVLFQALKGDFDCICLTEAHINSNFNVNQFGFTGYEAYCTKYNTRKTDGVSVFVKTSLDHEIQEIKITDTNCIKIQMKKK